MKRIVRYAPFAALVTLVGAACDGDGLTGPEVEQLALRGGCGDVIFYAVDGADEVMLTFVTQGPVAQALGTGQEFVYTYPLRPGFGIARGDVHLVQGSRVSDATCDDVIENAGPQIRRSWTAVEGSATVSVRPLAEQDGAMADLLLEDVLLESDDGGRTIRIDRMEWAEVFVGWLPG